MTILDANILIYAWNKAEPRHKEARKYIEDLLSNEDWVGIPWVTIWAFLRISTNPRAMSNPLSPREAFQIIEFWLTLPNVITVEPGPRHASVLQDVLVRSQIAGPLVTDAVLAALAIEQGAKLASTDYDFSRFPGLSWINPLPST